MKFLCVLMGRLCNYPGSGHDSRLKNLPEGNIPQGGSREFANVSEGRNLFSKLILVPFPTPEGGQSANRLDRRKGISKQARCCIGGKGLDPQIWVGGNIREKNGRPVFHGSPGVVTERGFFTRGLHGAATIKFRDVLVVSQGHEQQCAIRRQKLLDG